jgi:cell division septation protein DedD
MARFSFDKRTPDEEGLPEDEGTEVSAPEESGGGEKSMGLRRILIIVGIGVILIGAWYLAQPLFFAPTPPPPSIPVRPAPVAPPVKAPATPAKEAAPATPTKPPAEQEAKPTPPAPPAKTAAPAKEAAPAKPAAAPLTPGKAEAGKGTPAGKAAPTKKAEAKVTKKPGPKAARSYSIQFGAMVQEENAEALKRKLDASGFPAVIRKGTVSLNKQLVTVGEPTGKTEAEDLARRLNVDGFPSQLLITGGKYTPLVGAFFTLDEAIDLARELQKKNYPPKIVSKPATTVVYQVRHGKFDSRAAAMRQSEELKKKGFDFRIVPE